MNETILVVDDDKFLRIILEKKLSALGYRILLAEDGKEALALAHEEKPDLIISDWMMPNLDGLQFCRAIKDDEELRFTYFIILTAKDTQEDKIEGIEKGADDFLTKPFHDKELIARVRAGLRISGLQKEIIRLQHAKAITELAVTLGHEINNPLGILMLMLQVIQKKGDNETIGSIRKDIEGCLINGRRVANIVKRLSTLQDPHFKPYLRDSDTQMLDLQEGR